MNTKKPLRYNSKRILLIVIIFFITQNIFFDIYRGSAFNVLPHDDYAPYLLHILGEEGGYELEAPYTYRLFSVAIAIPFYYSLPLYKFTNLPEMNDNYLQALEALSMVSFLSILISSIFMYLITKKRFGGSEAASLTALLVSFLLFRLTGIYSIDPIAILLISIGIYYIQNKFLFATIVLLSVGFNEKIVIVFSILMISRLIFKVQKFNVYSLIPVLGLLIYILVRIFYQVPGNEYQIQPSTYLPALITSISHTLSLKGIVLNIIPTGIVAVLFLFALKENRQRKNANNMYFTNVDIVPLIGLFIIAHIMNVDYNVGRIAMYCFPLYLPLASIYLLRMISKD